MKKKWIYQKAVDACPSFKLLSDKTGNQISQHLNLVDVN